jgi:hypothetical protein
MQLVIDANVLISALASDGAVRTAADDIRTPGYIQTEIDNHRTEIRTKSGLPPNAFDALLEELFEGVVDDLGCRCVQVRFDGLKGVPATDLHDDAWIHLTIDKQPLGESTPEIMRTHILKVLVASRRCGVVCRALDYSAHPAFGEFDERVAGRNVFGGGIAMDVTLDGRWQVRVPWFPAGAGGILPAWDSQSIMLPVCRAFDMGGRDLWDFERTQPNVAPELEDEIVAVTGGGASEAIEVVVGEPDVVLVWFGGGF